MNRPGTSDDDDYAAIIPDVTDSLGLDTPPASHSSPTFGFTLHKVQMGTGHVLVKVFSGIPQQCLSSNKTEVLSKEFLNSMGKWKSNTSTTFSSTIIGYSLYMDSVLPSLVYQETGIAKDFLKEHRGINFLDFIKHITKGVALLHEKNIFHGDIRADNILVSNDGLPRIADNGLSCIIHLLDKYNITETEVSIATRWMPPEFACLEDDESYTLSKEGDIWSLGMTIFELWSGQFPYSKTKAERIPSKIGQGTLPEFPSQVLTASFEGFREHIKFLCGLCWEFNPAERVPAAKLEHCIQEMVDGVDVATVKKNFMLQKDQEFLSRKFPSISIGRRSGSSLDTSSVSSTSTKSTIDIQHIQSPSEASNASYGTERGYVGYQTPVIKKEETDETSTVSAWSHLYRQQDAGGSTGSRSAETAQAGRPTESGHRATNKPFRAFTPPPSPNSVANIVTSSMTELLNYKAKNKVSSLEVISKSVGDDHQLIWSTICTIDGKVYGKGSSTRKREANEIAAREALECIYKENPGLAADSSPSYLSAFNSYLVAHDFTDRIEMICGRSGPAHIPEWTCRLIRDEKQLSVGVSSTKQKAMEEAAKRAAVVWNSI